MLYKTNYILDNGKLKSRIQQAIKIVARNNVSTISL